jgi:type I restriction-modification system DNA methylase subunit
MSDIFKPLFNRDLLKLRADSFVPQLTDEQLRVIADWTRSVGEPNFKNQKEKPHQGAFLIQVFGILLGYLHYTANPENCNLKAGTPSTETKGGKAPDGRLGFYGSDRDLTRAVIELKAPAVDLDSKQASHGGMTPVEQAFSYVPKFDNCRWVIVSNFTGLRLYSSARGEGYGRQWNVADLKDPDICREFLYCLQKDHLISESDASIIDELAHATHAQEELISKEFYEFYKGLRSGLFDELVRANPASSLAARPEHEIKLLEKAQKILDRVLFICFSESRGLLPAGLIRKAIKAARSGFVKTTRWRQLTGLFDAIDKGDSEHKIHGYNGGLFRHDSELASLKINDEFVDRFVRLSEYDFLTDLNVNILGHIFEQSVSDLETLRGEIQREGIDRKKSKRKKEGIYYTPDVITRFIVESTIGSWLAERFSEIKSKYPLETVRGAKRKVAAEIRMWEEYLETLWNIKVLDPACGSGAFLVAAFDYLLTEYTRVNNRLSVLKEGQSSIFDWDKQILQENLYGVDLNSESAEITKLSLWLKTAREGKPLDNLDANIRCGNSIVPPVGCECSNGIKAAYGELPQEIRDRAFDWENEFQQVFTQGGFDCVIGNPPYIRQERLSSYKSYLRKTYRCFSSGADLYIYFFEQGLALLKEKGRLGYISSGTFARTSFAAHFRQWLPQVARFEKVVNFGENQPFQDAEMVYPTISILVKETRQRTFRALFMRGGIPNSIPFALETDGVDCDDETLFRPQWLFQPTRIANLSDRIMVRGQPLSAMAGLRMYRGVLTGLNEAFVIDQENHDRLIAQNKECAAILKKLVGGEDLRPWYRETRGAWLILIANGATSTACGTDKESVAWKWLQEKYPPLTEHLAGFERKGRDRCDKGHFWWELRSCDYYDAFDRPKILWPDISKLPRFSWDSTGCILSNTGYCMPGISPWILSILQSRLIWFCISQMSTPLRLRGGLWQYRLIRQFIERLPIITPDEDEKETLASLAMQATLVADERYAQHESVRHRIRSDLGDGKKKLNQKLERWWTIDFASFRKEVGTALGKDIPVKERAEWEEALGTWRENHDSLTGKLVNIEEEINDRVYRLYGLSDTDVQLLEEHCHKNMIYYSYGEP